MEEFGRILIFFGILISFFGVFLMLFPKVPFLGKLPGDILIKKDNFTFFFPLTTSIIISIILTLLFFLFGRK
jgi:uncharacterized protein HemY